MLKANKTDLNRILPFLRSHVGDCLYMYIDIGKYGVDVPYLDVWFDEDERGISLVVMRYHTNLSFFTDREQWNRDDVTGLIRQLQVNSVTGKKTLVDQIFPALDELYRMESGHVFVFEKIRPIDLPVTVESATESDMPESARLIMIDEEMGSYYEVQDLANQLTERLCTGMARNFIVRDQGKIIAHIASYAEYDGLATTGGLIVDPSYRSSLLGTYMENYLVEDLWKDGFTIYTFVTEKLRYRYLKAVGNPCVGEYGKLIKEEV